MSTPGVPTMYMAHCISCHRDVQMTYSIDRHRCPECGTVPAVVSCETLGHELRFTSTGDVECITEARILPDDLYEAMMDATPYVGRDPEKPCCRGAGLVLVGRR